LLELWPGHLFLGGIAFHGVLGTVAGDEDEFEFFVFVLVRRGESGLRGILFIN
jgi:hypothetical protein